MENGWSIWCRIWRVEASEGRPHGVKYSFTLHDIDGRRLLGYDNAQGVARKIEHDHRHPFRDTDRRVAYRFTDADSLIADFFTSVRTACETDGVAFKIVDEDLLRDSEVENRDEDAE